MYCITFLAHLQGFGIVTNSCIHPFLLYHPSNLFTFFYFSMNILDSVDLFESLTNGEKETLALFCQERLLHSGELLFGEWDDALAFYVVKSWSLKAYKDRSDGEKLLWYISPDELAWEMALFDPEAPKKRMASVRAMEDTLLLVIMDYAILELSKKHREIYDKISQIIIKRKKTP